MQPKLCVQAAEREAGYVVLGALALALPPAQLAAQRAELLELWRVALAADAAAELDVKKYLQVWTIPVLWTMSKASDSSPCTLCCFLPSLLLAKKSYSNSRTRIAAHACACWLCSKRAARLSWRWRCGGAPPPWTPCRHAAL
jgi:hypothetical protein